MTSRGLGARARARARGSGSGWGWLSAWAYIVRYIYIYIYILEARGFAKWWPKLNFTCRLDHSCVLLVRLALVWCNFSETDRNTIDGFWVINKKQFPFKHVRAKKEKKGKEEEKQLHLGSLLKKKWTFNYLGSLLRKKYEIWGHY